MFNFWKRIRTLAFFQYAKPDPEASYLQLYSDLDTVLSLSLSDCAPPLYILSHIFLRLAGPPASDPIFPSDLFLYINSVAMGTT
jgi:hypothetical protein